MRAHPWIGRQPANKLHCRDRSIAGWQQSVGFHQWRFVERRHRRLSGFLHSSRFSGPNEAPDKVSLLADDNGERDPLTDHSRSTDLGGGAPRLKPLVPIRPSAFVSPGIVVKRLTPKFLGDSVWPGSYRSKSNSRL